VSPYEKYRNARTARIDAQFKMCSRVGAGTEVELSVPARAAFARD